MPVNFGGDPGQDDYGLPPVDAEIPDDARELDRDVQAYHRELRMRRRQRLLRRLHEPLTRDGLVLPLLAGCLALTLLAGTLLTVFTGSQGTIVPPSRPGSSPARTLPRPGRVGGRLPDTLVLYQGQQTPVQSLPPSFVLALAPANCQCQPGLRNLSSQVTGANRRLYLAGGDESGTARLAAQAGLPAADAIQDIGGGLIGAFHARSLTAVFVRSDGTVAAIVRGGQDGVMRTAAIAAGLNAMSSPPSHTPVTPRNSPSPGASRSPTLATAAPTG